jgi:hydrogenase-4 component B
MNFFSAQILFFSSLITLFLGAIVSVCLGKNAKLARIAGSAFAIVGSTLGLIAGSYFLISGEVLKLNLPLSLPGFNLAFNIDRLAAFFIVLAALISLLASIYALGYLKHYKNNYNLSALGFFYNIFIASLFLVPAADNILLFLVVWELMSIASYFLVIFEKDKEENIKAGFIYFLMTHAGTAFILISFLLLNRYTGATDFSLMHAAAGQIPPLAALTILLSSLIGFGMKAGIIPLHIWLPEAHPAAPSHVSALMSGVMIKMGVYMMFRIFTDIFSITPLWFGVVVLIIGAVSSLLGVLYALAEHDIKRLLAYHSIENIGIILLGLGSGMIFISLGLKGLAAVALTASLFHVINHGIFKALLFLGAGSVISATHTRNMEEYGGLIKKMPQTALFFLVGSMAISALPPFNGFFSEWLCFQSLFSGANLGGSLGLTFLLAAGFLAFTSALAAACFVKAFGISFLARPRSHEAEHAKEVGPAMLSGMGILALLTLIFGVFAGSISGLLAKTSLGLSALAGGKLDSVFNFKGLQTSQNFSVVSAPVIFIGLLLAVLLTAAVVYFVSRKNKVTSNRTWDCGHDIRQGMEITATGFSRSIIVIFKGLLKPTKQTSIEYHDDEMRYFPKRQSVDIGREDVYQHFLYIPIKRASYWLSELAKKIQNGNINLYILYIFLTLIILLLTAVR